MKLFIVLLIACSTQIVSSLKWFNITNATERGALCNDFSPAGYFIRRNPLSLKWVIYLEGGGGCMSPQSCNERYIASNVRSQYSHTVNGSTYVDVQQAWYDYSNRSLDVISKLMTTLWRFSNSSSNWTIQGRNILSTKQSENPSFYSHNHILIPYCSSDLWLMKSLDYIDAKQPNFCFYFNPNSLKQQFTFRGVSIFQSTIADLFEYHGLNKGSEVLFAGSSAGGVGVLNHAKWLKRQLEKHNNKCKLKALMDSAWFINFNGNMEKRFSKSELKNVVKSGEIIEHCAKDDFDPLQCLSASSFLTAPGLYPDIPTMVVFSMYDLYFLFDSIVSIPTDTGVIEAMRIVSEYSGSMNFSLTATINSFKNLSYFTTSCFQHVYLATSSLWDRNNSFFGNATIDAMLENNRFMHAISSDIWGKFRSTDNITFGQAIQRWIENVDEGITVSYEDSCSGPHCNVLCPDTITLGETTPYWDTLIQICVLLVIIGITLTCILIKVLTLVCESYLAKQQKKYLKETKYHSCDSILPFCSESNAISVACLNLRYSVNLLKRSSPNSLLTTEEDNKEAKLSSNNEIVMKRKDIICGISTYFNPGELVAIMGPSGSGKTTFLDLLAGRRHTKFEGNIFVNGISLENVQQQYIANSGYVLQLATPYYTDLTVRDNMTLAAQIRLPKGTSLAKRLERIEHVIIETGLSSMGNIKVGGSTGSGLSGGQKRRLCVALQLLNMPSILFLDEPTSGLDASSSLELLTQLNRVAASNRAVILTIHQPRLEIFHLFHKIILLCQGKVAYHGVPEKAYEVFMDSYKSFNSSDFFVDLESKNPADVIMDMLGSENMRLAILQYYENTNEAEAIKNAIENSRTMSDRRSQKIKTAGPVNCLLALETRAMKMASTSQFLYLPLIFLSYGIIIGSVYLQTESALSILSGFGIFSCASGLFMFPVIYGYFHLALEIFTLENSDGVGNSAVMIMQAFMRYTALSAIPVSYCFVVLYIMIIPYAEYNLYVFIQVLIFNLALNQTWIALLIFVIAATPSYSHRISPVLSAIAGFSGGFFLPYSMMPIWYQWLFYINPNYYGFSAMIRVLLQDMRLECNHDSAIECYPTSGSYILTHFDLHNINPFYHVTILIGMTILFLVLGWIALKFRYSNVSFFWKMRRNKQKKSNEVIAQTVAIKRNRCTYSNLLQEGETHEVWKPGRHKRNFKHTLDDRRKSLMLRINSYRSDCKPDKISSHSNKEKRLLQWKQIEVEAFDEREESNCFEEFPGESFTPELNHNLHSTRLESNNNNIIMDPILEHSDNCSEDEFPQADSEVISTRSNCQKKKELLHVAETEV